MQELPYKLAAAAPAPNLACRLLTSTVVLTAADATTRTARRAECTLGLTPAVRAGVALLRQGRGTSHGLIDAKHGSVSTRLLVCLPLSLISAALTRLKLGRACLCATALEVQAAPARMLAMFQTTTGRTLPTLARLQANPGIEIVRRSAGK